MELEITWKRTVKVWWSYLWRNLIAIICAIILSFIFGFIVALTLGAFHVSVQAQQIIVAPIGAIIGLLSSIVPIKMILGKDFGEFRLVLLKKEDAND
jgi:hypothetical protein